MPERAVRVVYEALHGREEFSAIVKSLGQEQAEGSEKDEVRIGTADRKQLEQDQHNGSVAKTA